MGERKAACVGRVNGGASGAVDDDRHVVRPSSVSRRPTVRPTATANDDDDDTAQTNALRPTATGWNGTDGQTDGRNRLSG